MLTSLTSNIILYHESPEKILFKLSELFPLTDSVIDIAKKNNLNYILTGHLSLISLFEKAYREPSDIDIIIDGKEIRKWIDVLKNDWFSYCDENQILQSEGAFIKKFFASVNGKTYADNDPANIFYVNENVVLFTRHEESLSADLNHNNQNVIQNPWVIHEPNNSSPFGSAQFENINNEYFRVSFKMPAITNRGKNYSAYLTLLDESKNIIQIEKMYDEIEINKDNKLYSESWWISDFTKKPKNTFYYKIHIEKNDLLLQFLKKPHLNTKLELIIDGDFSNFNYIQKNIDGNIINLSYPEKIFSRKYGRQKDHDDMNFFKN